MSSVGKRGEVMDGNMITVGELKHAISQFDDDNIVFFNSGGKAIDFRMTILSSKKPKHKPFTLSKENGYTKEVVQ